MKLHAAASASLLLLAACGSSAGNNGTTANGTAAAGNQASAPGPEMANGATPVATPVAGAQLQAGQWEMTSVMRSIDSPGMPAEQAAAIRQQIGRPNVSRVCMTEEQARDFSRFVQREQTRGCTIGEQVYGNGVIRMGMTCPMPDQGGGTVRMTLTGTYTPVTLNLTMNQQMSGRSAAGGGPTSATVNATASGRRIGPCPAGGARPPAVVAPPAPAPR